MHKNTFDNSLIFTTLPYITERIAVHPKRRALVRFMKKIAVQLNNFEKIYFVDENQIKDYYRFLLNDLLKSSERFSETGLESRIKNYICTRGKYALKWAKYNHETRKKYPNCGI